MSPFSLILLSWTILLWIGICPSPMLAQERVAPTTGEALFQKGESYFKDQPDSAKYYYEKAIPFLEKEQNWEEQVKALCLIYRLLHQRRAYDQIEAYAYAAYQLATERLEPGSRIHTVSINNLSTYLFIKGRYEEASDSLLQAIRMLEDDSNPKQSILAKYYHNLGFLYTKQGDYNQAIQYYRQSFALKKRATSSRTYRLSLAVSQHVLGRTFQHLQQIDSARLYYLRAIDILNEDLTPSHLSKKVDVLLSLTNIELQQDHVAIAQQYLDEAKQLQEQSSSRHLDRIYELQAHIYQQSQLLDEALEQYQLALQQKIQNLGPTHIELAITYKYLGQLYQAKHVYHQALAHFDKGLQLLFSEELKKYQTPVEAFHLLLAQSEVYQSLSLTDSAYLADALQALIQAKDVLHDIRLRHRSEESKLFWSERKSQTLFQQIVDISYQLYQQSQDELYMELAFQAAEESKGFLLFEAQAETEAEEAMGLPEIFSTKERRLLQEISYYEKTLIQAETSSTYKGLSIPEIQEQLFSLYRERDRWLDTMATTYPAYVKQKYQHTTISIEEVSQALPKDQILIEYIKGTDKWYLFAISNHQSFFQPLTLSSTQLHHTLSSFHTHLHAGDLSLKSFGQYSQLGHQLYQILFPAEVPFSSFDRIIVIPEGKLAEIPVEILVKHPVELPTTKRAIISSWRSLPYLLKDHAVLYAYSATTLLSAPSNNKNRNYSKRWLGIAPKYSQQLALVANIPEVQNIARNLTGDVLSGREATKSQFLRQAEEYRILHLAVHGVADPKHPSLSYLQFANDIEGESSRLYMYENQYLGWSPELVVLSACETGKGKWQQGAGILSMAHSFFIAGCRSVLNTLWVVDDQISQELSIGFYRSIQNGYPKDEALQHAKLQILTTTQPEKVHPIYWAPFIMSGDADPIRDSSTSTFFIIFWLIGIGGLILVLLMNRQALDKLME
ncbi:MAG: CHAT domain-containing tetratricopeptide repeat protein [Bacteroidota bacterium]